jgi:hypothetical protein
MKEVQQQSVLSGIQKSSPDKAGDTEQVGSDTDTHKDKSHFHEGHLPPA